MIKNMSTLNTPTPTTPTTNSFEHNGVNKQISWQSPQGYLTAYEYDKQRRITGIIKPSLKRVDYAYLNGRLNSITTSEKTTSINYACADKPSHVSTTTGESIDYSYDGDLLTNVSYSGVLNQDINYVYNTNFVPTTFTYAGLVQNLGYNTDGELIQSNSAILTRNTHSGLVTSIDEGTYTQSRSYNRHEELKSKVTTVANKDVFRLKIVKRNKKGNITKAIETIAGVKTTYRYRYNKMGQLVKVKKNDKVIEKYSYDNNGNRLSKTIFEMRTNKKGILKRKAIKTNSTIKVEDQLEQVGNRLYAYDEDGYLSSKITPQGTTQYHYGTLGELISIILEDGTIIEYLHNANNQRVAKKINSVIVEKYLWKDLTTLLAVYDGDDNLIQRYEYTDSRVPYAMTHNNQRYFLAYDQVGTLKAVIDVDGNVVKALTYDIFGNILNDTNESLHVNLGFAGGLYDKDTKLTRFGYRDYDSQTGKWTAKDPIGFRGGDTNLYRYVLNDPVNLVDPEGKAYHIVGGMIAGAGFAIATGTWTGFFIGGIVDAGNVANACKVKE